MTINVVNDQKIDLMSTTMDFGLESLDGQVDTVIVAKTPCRICGRMKPTKWLQVRHQWKHKEHSLPKTRKEKQNRRPHWFRLLQSAISYMVRTTSDKPNSRTFQGLYKDKKTVFKY